MNDSDLQRLLKAAKLPIRPEEYWHEFPRRVQSHLSREPVPEPMVAMRWFLRLAWGLATAAMCLAIGFAIGPWHIRMGGQANGILETGKLIDQTLAMFPNRVRAIVQDDRGLSLVLSDNADVPVSTPLWVKVCDGRHCSTLLTFSGQEVQVADKAIVVLAEAQGGVLIVGDRFVWSSESPSAKVGGVRIEARQL